MQGAHRVVRIYSHCLLKVRAVELSFVFDHLLNKSQSVAEGAVTRPQTTLGAALLKLIGTAFTEEAVLVNHYVHNPARRFLFDLFTTSTASFGLDRPLQTCFY